MHRLALVGIAAIALNCALPEPDRQSRLDRSTLLVSPAPSTRLPLLKRPERTTADYPQARDYLRVIERFPLYVARGWRDPATSGHPVGFFGDPDHAEMGLRSLGNTVLVLATLAMDADYDARVTGFDRRWCLARARDCLTYMTRGHVTGDLACADGKQWGNHWQSAWWTAKMAMGAKLIWSHLDDTERHAVERVVAFEADRHLSRKAPGGALSNTRSEENAWDTEVLAAAVALMPQHANASRWRAKLIEFALNSLSAPQDASDSSVVDGRPLEEQIYTANIHRDFTIENHGAYHTCYMACPLHSLAWGCYAIEASGQQPPAAQFHHFTDVWNRMKPTFLLRRFAYPAGKDWPRYAYGMSFIMPALVVLQYRFGDAESRAIERQRMLALEAEQLANADGSFYGKRFTRNIMVDRMAEYETDTYANLALCYLLHRRWGPPARPVSLAALHRSISSSHVSREAGLAWVRTPRAFASMAWRRLDGPFPAAYFIPVDHEDLAEWGINNLLGRIVVEGVDPSRTRVDATSEAKEGRLNCRGSLTYRSKAGDPLYTHHIVFQADPIAGHAYVEYLFVADASLRVQSREGLRLHIANDFFNGYRRVWHHDGSRYVQRYTPREPPPDRETLREVRFAGNCINVDGRLGVADLDDTDRFALRVSDRANGPWGSVHYAVLDCPRMDTQPRTYRRGDTILSGRFLVVLGDLHKTRSAAARLIRKPFKTTSFREQRP